MSATRSLRNMLIGVVCSACIPLSPLAARAAEDEYAVKAAFLMHFINYVSWPEDVLGGANDPIRVCMVGDNPFGDFIQPITAKQAHGRPIELVMDPGVESERRCHVIFFSTREAAVLRQQLTYWGGKGVLTIGDTARILDLGGVIGYITVNNRVRFALNHDAAEAAGLRVSVKLRKVAVKR